MRSEKSYKTLVKPSEGIYKEKGSKFFSYAYPADSEEDVKFILQKLRKEHHSARHHCYAFVLGTDRSKFRANDDGEPSGTAGKPILGQINSFELTNVVIVIVRYFGGTLLGTGGLIRSYRVAAIDALQNGNIITKTIKKLIKIKFPYLMMNEVMKLLKDRNIRPINQKSGQICEITAEVSEDDANIISGKLQHLEKIIITYI